MSRYALLFLSLLLSPSLAAQASAASASAPEDFLFVTTDIDHFWEAYDLAYPWFFPQVFDSLYLRRGTAGLRPLPLLFPAGRDSFSRQVRQNWDYYEAVRPAMTALRDQESGIRAAAFALKYLYPEARFPDIYFLVGAPAGGHAIIGGRIVIDAALFGPSNPGPTRARRYLPAPYAAEQAAVYVAHTLARYQQAPGEPAGFPERCIREGVAELIAELMTGRRLHEHLDTLIAGREEDLRGAFLSALSERPDGRWRPTDAYDIRRELGIWTGYQIARAYYDRASDKRAAIREMLHIADYRTFLEDSGWEEKERLVSQMEEAKEATLSSALDK